ncbi:hypothetical protein MY04_2010 [Flammeovirga sp. MY04]|uniref:Uncharacterized protein n=1 Tax=Flammeovirga yaeyamensis TaxID=367791 RepID=B1A1E5_9BACT|nr:hypothetical protein [Flammeovirga sp. MY04]ACA05080.1 hypothetical protein [Flammeovirga yaeyamensis]ANQ49384.1 hypothetical protein MY04_2010 [Flammeovirga sp. MY04]
MNTLSFKTRICPRTQNSFYDFSIDGESLFDICDMEKSDRIGSLGWGLSNDYNKSLFRQFLNEEENKELKSGRIMLFVCSECGDIGCGGTTFKLIETETEIIWTEFGDEDNIELDIDFSDYKNIGPFRFEKTEYKRLFIEYMNLTK